MAGDERRVQARRAEEYDIAHGAGLAMSAEDHAIELVRGIQLSEDIQAKTVIANTWIIALVGFDHMASLRDAHENWVTQATMWSTSLSTMQEEPEYTSEVLRLAFERMREEMREHNRCDSEFLRSRAAVSQADAPVD